MYTLIGQLQINKIISHPTEQSQIGVSIDGNNNCGIWSLESGDRDHAFWASSTAPLTGDRDKHGHNIRSMEFSPDGKTLFTGGTDRRIRKWNWENATISGVIAQAATDQSEGKGTP